MIFTKPNTKQTIDSYISTFPKEVQIILQKVRETIAKVAPKAEEAIKYGIPTFVQNGNLVHFGGFKQHVGFYPTPAGIRAFEKELSKYESSKGAVKFPLDQTIPYTLIAKIVKYRVKENLKKKV
jgi:uncharacterized protein YdhG (YjbR/CyaY superfamily)